MANTDGNGAGQAAAQYLREQGLVLATAESCTAGLIASRLASAQGAGQVLESAFVVYDPKAKHRHCLLYTSPSPRD